MLFCFQDLLGIFLTGFPFLANRFCVETSHPVRVKVCLLDLAGAVYEDVRPPSGAGAGPPFWVLQAGSHEPLLLKQFCLKLFLHLFAGCQGAGGVYMCLWC